MASKATYRLAAAIDSISLWQRLGGRFALLGIAGALFLTLFEGVPRWVGPGLVALAAACACHALWRMRPFLAVRRNGVPIEARISRIEEHRRGNPDGHNVLKKRATFSYEVDGIEYTGRTTWGMSGRFEHLDTGSPIPLIVDPSNPNTAVWEKDMPIRMPQIIGL